MKISINRQSQVSVREQVYLEIAQRIRSGLLQAGTKLPSVREMAEEVGISLVTAHEIYKMLADSRLVDTIQGKGTFVRCFLAESKDIKTEAPFSWQVSIPDYLPRASLWSQSSVRLPESILNLAEASVHHSLLPIEFIQASIRTSLTCFPETLGCYSHFKGDAEFLAVLTEYLKLLSIELKSHQLLVTNGTQQGINLFAQTFLGPNDTIAVETPCFSGAIDAFRLSHAHLQPIPVDEEGLRVDILEDLWPQMKLKAIYTVPTGQNPTGAVMSLSRRQDLLAFARSHNVLILEDEPYREIELSSHRRSSLPPPIKMLDTDGRVIYIKGFSKFLFPGLRLGLLAADGSIYNRLLAAKSIADLGSPLWLQKSLIPLFRDPKLLRCIEKISARLEARRQKVFALFDKLLDRRVVRSRYSSGLYSWLTMPPGIDTDSLIPEAHRRGIHFLPGSIFYAGEPETNHLRVSWANLSDEDLPKALTILCGLLNDAIDRHEQGM